MIPSRATSRKASPVSEEAVESESEEDEDEDGFDEVEELLEDGFDDQDDEAAAK